MNICIAGGGRVGSHLARLLCIENNDVTVIESDPGRLEQTEQTLDVHAVIGNASSLETLQSAAVGNADLFIAVTGSDEINLVSASTAKGLGTRQTIARVDSPTYTLNSMFYEAAMNIDYLLSPDALTAREVARFMENPGLIALEDFSRGKVRMCQLQVSNSSVWKNKVLKDICPPGTNVLVGAISRSGKTHIPNGQSVIEAGDLVTIIGPKEQMGGFQKLIQGHRNRTESVIIMGGGNIGAHLALALENSECHVKLMEPDHTICTRLAAHFTHVDIVCRDATKRAELEQEHVDTVNLFVATSDDDENNIMGCVLAKEVGAQQTVAVVHHPDFVPLVHRLGIDHTVTPRTALANRVLRMLHQEKLSTLASLQEGQVEVIELTVTKESAVTNNSLSVIKGKLPSGVLVATLLRGDKVIIPGGNDHIEIGDSVVMITSLANIETLQKLFIQ